MRKSFKRDHGDAYILVIAMQSDFYVAGKRNGIKGITPI